MKMNNKNNNNNYILSEIYIKEKDLNKDIRIINLREEKVREDKKNKDNILFKILPLPERPLIEDWKNEEKIKKIKIKRDGELIPFNYFHIFKNEGKYLKKYEFNCSLVNLVSLFENCTYIININLSYFNSENINKRRLMFHCYSSLKDIN